MHSFARSGISSAIGRGVMESVESGDMVPRHDGRVCVLADDDAAWVRERYAADAELWASISSGDGGFRAVF